MRLTIEQFRKKFNFSEMAIEGMKESHLSKNGGYYKFNLDVYRGDGCLEFKGTWLIDFNEGYCECNEEF